MNISKLAMFLMMFAVAQAGCDGASSNGTIPTVTISSTAPDPTNTSPIPVTVRFSETVTGFSWSDFTLTNATVSSLTGSGLSYSLALEPLADGVVVAKVKANAAQNAAGNGNTASGEFSRTYDGTAPTVTWSTTASDPTNASPIPVTATWNESVTDFGGGDVTVYNAARSNFAGSGDSYTFDLTPKADGTVTADIAAGAVQDAAGNESIAATQFTIEYDGTAPTVVMSSVADEPTEIAPIPVTVTFSEDVVGFDESDLTVTNASIDSFSGSGSEYSFYLVPPGAAVVTVDILAGVAQDVAGNDNEAAQFTRTYAPVFPPVPQAIIEVNESDWIVERRDGGWGYENVSPTQSYAPMPVFFEGWKSLPQSEIAEYEWDFGDGSSTFKGFNAAHVYETAGTYEAELTVTNVYGMTDSDSITIDVMTPDGTTYYVDSALGADSNDGTSPGAGAWQTAEHAFSGIGEKRYSPGDRILFTRGQTFLVESKTVVFAHWPGYGFSFGAYGDGADPKPLIQFTGMATSDNPSVDHPMIFPNTGSGLAHVAFVDLAFNGTSDIDANNMATIYYSSSATQNLLFYRCDFEDFLNGFMTQSPDPGVVFGIFIVECTFYRSATTHLFAEATHYAVVDTSLDLSGNHIAYLGVLDTAVITGNHFSRPAFGRTALRICGREHGGVPTENIVITDNIFEGWIDPVVNDYDAMTNSLVGTTPEAFEGYFIAGPSEWAQSWGRAHNGDGTRYNYSLVGLGTGAEEISNTISNALFEGNTIIDAEVMLETHTSDDLVVRNNVLTTQDTSTSSRIKVYAPGVKSGPIQDLLITHNTITAARNAVRVNPIFEVSPYELEAFEGRVRHENIVIEQNVIIMDADKSRVISFRENDADQIAEVNTDENIVYWTDETELFQAGGDVVAPGDLYSLAEWRTLTGMDSGTQVYTSNDLPVPGWATSPPEVRDFPIAVAYTGATDNSGTGLAEVRLWVKIATGDWEDTGLTSTGEQGSFNYTDASSDGSPATYYFALQAEDNNTNVSPAPIGDNGHCSTEYDPL